MRALFIQQDHVSPPGPVGDALVERGYEIVEFNVVPEERFDDPHLSVEFPDPREFDLIVPMGAVWAVYDADKIHWIAQELELLRTAHESGVSILGLCFGGQALAAALGGAVRPAGGTEVGWTVVDTDDADLVAPGPWFEWHSDLLDPPPGATVVARTELCPQAFVIGHSMGVQFHPELTPTQLESWLAHGGRTYLEDHDIDADALLSETRGTASAAAKRTRTLVNRFLDTVAARP